jgi:DNA-directed RNA polymerase specialized sigma24 family protein
MEQRETKRREAAPAGQTEDLLNRYYTQLLQWGAVLTRGDIGKAQDIVQEFCLYFTFTKPDLSAVSNLDGYLYTCLRHIYLSGLSRSSREASRFVSIADFDSFDFAMVANRSADPLQVQNDLRRICSYTVWRKQQSKSASYFILHFFHGYTRREIADLACLPISGIYNKLKNARDEVKVHLVEGGKLRVITGGSAPTPRVSWTLLSPEDVFKEFRQTILSARAGDCLDADTLLARYGAPSPQPLSCSLLSHIVSCERCLRLIDDYFRRPTLKDREALDDADISPERNTGNLKSDVTSQRTMLHSVRKRWKQVHEHRPNTLSIAVNGKIIAFHDVQSSRSILSARVESQEKDRFVEVFSEQDVRLALLPVGEPPPNGPHELKQRVSLSDSRWLELTLVFDGFGLNSEVTYYDPALASVPMELEAEDFVHQPEPIAKDLPVPSFTPLRPVSWVAAAYDRFLRPLLSSGVPAWSLAIAILISAVGYMAYRRASAPMNIDNLLKESVRNETASLQGQTEHQSIDVEEVSADGQILQTGSIDLWKDGDGSRYMRRLYDSRKRLVATEWKNKSGSHRSASKERDRDVTRAHHVLSMDGIWDQDLSASAFNTFKSNESHLVTADGGYELTVVAPIEGHPQIISATLVLNRDLSPVRQTLRVRAGSAMREIRFIQSGFERKPSSAVPDTIFDPAYTNSYPAQGPQSYSGSEDRSSSLTGSKVQLAQLQISVLYLLNTLGADVGQPIEVTRTPEGRLRISGVIARNALQQEIVSRLNALADHELLDLRLTSGNDLRGLSSVDRMSAPGDTRVYDINVTKPFIESTIRKHFQSKGLSEEAVNASVEAYTHEALQHAQRALQNAYALHRLGSALSATELSSIGTPSRAQWTEMVSNHATALADELHRLHDQLAEIAPLAEAVTNQGTPPIETSGQFNETADQVLHQAQELNRNVGRLFAADPLPGSPSDPTLLLASTIKAIPLEQAEVIVRFAGNLKNAEKATLVRPKSGDDEKGIVEQSR